MVGGSVGWLAGLWVGLVVCWWWVGRLVGRWVGLLVGWLVGGLVNWLVN